MPDRSLTYSRAGDPPVPSQPAWLAELGATGPGRLTRSACKDAAWQNADTREKRYRRTALGVLPGGSKHIIVGMLTTERVL